MGGAFWAYSDPQDRPLLIRTPEDQELVSDQWTIKALAEGETWVETMNGCRLPASVVAKKPSVYT